MVDVADETRAHYERLAATYDDNWAYSPEYIAQFSRAIVDTMGLTSSDLIADVGCGTGLYTRQLLADVQPESPIVCVDPVQAMLDQLPDDPGLVSVRASAEDLAFGRVTLPVDRPLDAIVMKEAIHHVDDQAATIAGLARLLAPGGRILIAMLPERIEYPLFRAALEKFERDQPSSAEIVAKMRSSSLGVRCERVRFPIEVSRDRYLGMVRARYMSLLSAFTDDEVEAGIIEIQSVTPSDTYSFDDIFVFVLGLKD